MLPINLKTEVTGSGKRIELPHRDLTSLQKLGWLPLGMGLLGLVFMSFWISGPLLSGIGMIRNGQPFGWALIAFGSLGFIGLFYVLKIFAFGIAVVRNRVGCSVLLNDRFVISRERFGWFRFDIKIPRGDIASLYILKAIPVEQEGDPDESRRQSDALMKFMSDDWYAISQVRPIRKSNGKLIAALYPQSVLLPLANLIKEELDAKRADRVEIVTPNQEANVDLFRGNPDSSLSSAQAASLTGKSDNEPAELQDLPADSLLEVVDQGGTEVYRIPSQGIWKGSHGLVVLPIGWFVFMTFMTVIMIRDPNADLVMAFVIALFWLIGIGLGVLVAWLGTRSAMIGVLDGLLFIEQKSILGTKWREFSAKQIESIAIGDSSMRKQDVPVKELVIFSKSESGKRQRNGLFSQLANNEIVWLAEKLNRSLNIDRSRKGRFLPDQADDGKWVKPPTSKVVVTDRADAIRIAVPAAGLRTCIGFVCSAMVFVAIAVAVGMGLPDIGWLIAGGIIVVAIAAVAWKVVYACRRFEIVATAQRLEIERIGVGSGKSFAIDRPEIRTIRAQDSGAKVNDRKLWELVVHSQSRRNAFTMMTGRDPDEIGYVAALLNDRLGMPKPTA